MPNLLSIVVNLIDKVIDISIQRYKLGIFKELPDVWLARLFGDYYNIG